MTVHKDIQKKNAGLVADMIALPFWIILIIYASWKIHLDDKTAWLIIVIVGGAFIIDSALVLTSFKKK